LKQTKRDSTKAVMSKILKKRTYEEGVNLAETIQKTLPEDLQRYIYSSYLWFEAEKKPLCDELLHWLNYDEQVKRLKIGEGSELNKKIKIIEELVQCRVCVEYLCKQDKDINACYQYHFIEKERFFKLMSNPESFIYSIVMTKYH
jgi:hypothetical protein